MGSTRFPGKPLVKIGKETMISRIVRICENNKYTNHVYVATCDQEIKNDVEMNNHSAIMTSNKHTRASDRCSEALKKIEKKLKKKFDIVTMVQGDEPLIRPYMLNKAMNDILKSSDEYLVSNCTSYIQDKKEFNDRNIIKIIKNRFNDVISFSREPIPHLKKFKKNVALRQVCIISFKRAGLIKYSELKETDNEKNESVDMFRFLDNNFKIKLTFLKDPTYPVDTIKDLKKVRKILNK